MKPELKNETSLQEQLSDFLTVNEAARILGQVISENHKLLHSPKEFLSQNQKTKQVMGLEYILEFIYRCYGKAGMISFVDHACKIEQNKEKRYQLEQILHSHYPDVFDPPIESENVNDTTDISAKILTINNSIAKVSFVSGA